MGEIAMTETVVLLHGIGDHAVHMAAAARSMKKAGYNTVNLTYPSTKKDLSGIAEYIDNSLTAKNVWITSSKVHFVTHSMGGLAARVYLAKYQPGIPVERMGRVVMIAPPHGGSEVADFFKDFAPFRWIYGPAGQQLGTTATRPADNTLPWYDVGIIAGNRAWPVSSNLIMPQEHDGCVSVASTKLPGMKEHLIFKSPHTFISWNSKVHRHAVQFLQTGSFNDDRS